MDILFFGLACNEKTFEKYIEKNTNPYSVAHYIFETELINQLENFFKIDHNYIFQMKNKKIHNSLVHKKIENITEKTLTKHINYLNLPVLNYITIFISTFIRIFSYSRKNKNFIIISSINYLPVALATIISSKLLKKDNVIIFTDCSTGNAYTIKNRNIIKNFFIKINKKIIEFCENSYDYYVLFSEPMNEIVNKKKKPFCVMEGFLNQKDLNLERVEKFSEFTVMYAGSIIEDLGLENLIESVKEIPNAKLYIVGEGSLKDKLKNENMNYDNIIFVDFMNRKELFNLEKKVSLLANVRDPRLEYTKYSFPSKTFEYLVSNTPFLSTKLECYSAEYDDIIFFIDNNQPLTIKNKIIDIMQADKKYINKYVENAKNYILENKNSKVQTSKIINFINEVILYEE